MAVTVIIDLPAKPGGAEEIKSFVRSIVPDTRTFDGFQGVTMHQNQDDPDLLVLRERWESREHQEKYLAWRTERGDFAAIVGMLAARPSIRYFDDLEL